MIIYQAFKKQFLTNFIKISQKSTFARRHFSTIKQPPTQSLFRAKTTAPDQNKGGKINYTNRNVKNILTFYTKQVAKENFFLSNIISICKQLTQQYKKQTHLQFALQRKEIEALLQHLARLQLKDATFQDFLSIMELIKALKHVQNISKTSLQTLKHIVLLKILPFRQKCQVFSLQKQVRLYCILSQLQEKNMSQLGIILQNNILSSQQQDKNWSKLLADLLQALSKKQKFQPIEQQLLELIFKTLESKLQKFDHLQILRTASAINADRFLILKNTTTLNTLYSAIIQKLNSILQSEIQPKVLKFALSSNVQQGNFLKEFYKKLYYKIFSRIVAQQNNYFLLQNLCSIVVKLKGKHANQQDAAKVVDFISYALTNKNIKYDLFQKKRCQIYLLELIQLRYFDDSLKLLDKLIIKQQIQIYWSFPFQYSVREVKFPLHILLAKIKPGSLNFKQDSNYLKMAVSIAVQTWLHDDERLQNYYQEVKSKVNSAKFTINEIQWLIRQYQINPILVKLYHKYYCAQFQDMLYKIYSPLLFTQSKDANKYWIYLLNLCQPHENFVIKIPFKVVKLILQRQFQTYQNENSIINALIVKKLIQMLRGLQSTSQLEQAKNKSDFQIIFKQKIIKYLLLWFDRLPNSSKEAAQLYIELIILLLNKHVKKSWHMSESLKILTVKLVICDYKIIRETKFFSNLKKSIHQNLKDDQLLHIFQNLRERGQIQQGQNKQR